MSTAPAILTGEARVSPAEERETTLVHSIPEGLPYLFSTDDFYRMIELGVFPEEARVGLWDGWIYEKMAKLQPHAVSGTKANYALIRILPEGWFLTGENPVTIGPDRAPLPDMAVVRGIPDDYIDRRPVVADLGLIVELSDSSLRIDLGVKLAAYAGAGIPVYWVVNLKDRLIQTFETPIPTENRYAVTATYRPGESIPFTLDGARVALIAANDLLPIR